jgi:hypothetical protein
MSLDESSFCTIVPTDDSTHFAVTDMSPLSGGVSWLSSDGGLGGGGCGLAFREGPARIACSSFRKRDSISPLILDGVNFRLPGFNCEDTHWVGTLTGAVVGRPGLFFHGLAPKRGD